MVGVYHLISSQESGINSLVLKRLKDINMMFTSTTLFLLNKSNQIHEHPHSIHIYIIWTNHNHYETGV